MPVVELKNVDYVYNVGSDKKSLDSINLRINEGRYVCVIGKTGSGKTTLAENLALILKPTGGQVLFDGCSVWDNKAFEHKIRMKIGLIFQFAHHQLFAETVEQDIAFGPKQQGLSQIEVRNRVEYAAGLVGISEQLFSKSPFELSGGQQKRVAIAGVLAMKPKILILDEPTVGIDPQGREQILKIIRTYHDQQNCTTIHVTHNMQEVTRFADEVLVMVDGKVHSYDSVDRTFEKVNMLKNLGFDVPQIVEVFLKLKQKGFKVPTNVYSVEEAAKVVCEIVLGKVKKF